MYDHGPRYTQHSNCIVHLKSVEDCTQVMDLSHGYLELLNRPDINGNPPGLLLRQDHAHESQITAYLSSRQSYDLYNSHYIQQTPVKPLAS